MRQTQSGTPNKITGQRSWYIEFLNPNDPRTEHQRLTDIDYHAAMKRIPSDERTEIWKTITDMIEAEDNEEWFKLKRNV